MCGCPEFIVWHGCLSGLPKICRRLNLDFPFDSSDIITSQTYQVSFSDKQMLGCVIGEIQGTLFNVYFSIERVTLAFYRMDARGGVI